MTDAATDRAGSPRQIRARARSRGYSRFVGYAKLVLPMTAGGLIVALAAWPVITASFDHLRASLPKLNISEIKDLRMLSPRYTGIDKAKRPFTLTADIARQTPGNGDLVALDVPKANIQTKEGAWVVMTGDTGIYQSQTHFLDLFKNVTLFHDHGYEFKTNSARVDLNGGTAEGDESISGGGPSGTITGQGFRVLDRGDAVVFTGKARLIMNGAHGEAR
jgi:lipopolysaccharide export system protein LptC